MCFMMFHNVLRVFHDVLLVVHDVLLVVHNVLHVYNDVFHDVLLCLTMFSESHNDRRCRIGGHRSPQGSKQRRRDRR